jgi:hypothetical protein
MTIAAVALLCSGAGADARRNAVRGDKGYRALPQRRIAEFRRRGPVVQCFPGRRGAGAAIGDKEAYGFGDPSRSDADAWRFPNNSGYHCD